MRFIVFLLLVYTSLIGSRKFLKSVRYVYCGFCNFFILWYGKAIALYLMKRSAILNGDLQAISDQLVVTAVMQAESWIYTFLYKTL